MERRCTHPQLLPLIETEIVYLTDGDIMEKIAVVVPVNKVAKPRFDDRKRSIQGSKNTSHGTVHGSQLTFCG